MTEYADIIIAGALVVVLSSLLLSLLWPVLLRTVHHCRAAARARLLLIWSLLPWLSAIWVTIVLVHPRLAGVFFHQHCHGDVCGPHIPDIGQASLSGSILAALITLAVILLLLVGSHRLQRNSQRLQQIRMLSEQDQQSRYRLIDSPLLLAWCTGLWQPQVYLSRGLTETLNECQLQIVLLHEYGHVLNRDNLFKLLLSIASGLWLPSIRKQLRSEYSQTLEQRADDAVIEQGFSHAEIVAVLALLGDDNSCHAPRSPESAADTAPATDAWFATLALLTAQIALFSYMIHPLLDLIFVRG